MPTVEDYFDDDTDLPLPSSSKPRTLPNTGIRGALLEEINDDGDGDYEMDYGRLAEQSRGVFGEDAKAPPPSANAKGKMVMRDEPGELRPTGGAPGMGNNPMGGFMGDMMKLQQAEEERMEKLRKEFGAVKVTDQAVYKEWNAVYPIYFDAKVSASGGRRVPRKEAVWWPQATQIAKACRVLGLPSVLEPERCHPADWENPGRVKVQIEKDGKYLNPIVKNRTQLCHQLAAQIQHQNPSLVYTPPARKAKVENAKAVTPKDKKKKSKSAKTIKAVALPSRPPAAPQPYPIMEDRLPVYSPLHAAGVAVSAIKRDLEQEKENKKKGITMGMGSEETPSGKEKQPKMKRVVVRGRR